MSCCNCRQNAIMHYQKNNVTTYQQGSIPIPCWKYLSTTVVNHQQF
jgi:hypothetical protein